VEWRRVEVVVVEVERKRVIDPVEWKREEPWGLPGKDYLVK
jgi:hypothetical protein